MKQIIIIVIVLLTMSSTGCLIYGKGEEACYVSAVDDGFFWGKVSTKTDLSSSDADVYLVSKENEELRNALIKVAEQKQRIKIKYKRHFLTATSDRNRTDDEIISLEMLD